MYRINYVTPPGRAPDTSPALAAPPGEPALPAPRSVADTGLPQRLLIDLLGKHLYVGGRGHVAALAERIRLPLPVLFELLDFMVRERSAEVVRRGDHAADVEYRLTDAGRSAAAACLLRCRYTGAAPVPLEAYCAQVMRQSVRTLRIGRDRIEEALEDLALASHLRDQVGCALNGARPVFLYGPAGSGKTTLAMRLAALVQGTVSLPYALAVDDEIVLLYDPLLHLPVDSRGGGDGRWVTCRRPVVHTGCELTLDMLSLRYDETAGFYHAPLHMKANNGAFVIDDVGTQSMPLRDLANRWLAPIDRGNDRLLLRSGYQFAAPFDCALVFAGRAGPEQFGDGAFIRRMAYKIGLGALTVAQYRHVVLAQCCALGVAFDAAAFDYLVGHLHGAGTRPMLAVYPHDLLGLIADHASYRRTPAVMSVAALDRAWQMLFPPGPASRTERDPVVDLSMDGIV